MDALKFSGIMAALVLVSGCQMFGYQKIERLPPTAAVPAESVNGIVDAWFFDGIAGYNVNNLTSSQSFPENPTDTTELTSLLFSGERGSDYGTLVRGFIEPPASGTFRFWVSGDDETQFWLSSSDGTADKTLIASVPGWTYPEEYDKYSSQGSPTVSLAAGSKYYFEILHKESGGDDHFSIAWEGPGISRQTVSGTYLFSWATEQKSISEDQTSQEAYSLGYRVGFFDAEQDLAFNPAFPPLDEDSDGLYDNWEVVMGLSPSDPEDATSDNDSDLLTAADEFLIGTSATLADTDGDGIPDGAEYAYQLDPLDSSDASEDLDGDGVTNLDEYLAGTDPNNSEDFVSGDDSEALAKYTSAFSGQYFTGTNFDSFVTTLPEQNIQFDWGSGAPLSSMPSDSFSVRWQGVFEAPHDSGTRDYRFSVTTDDGVRLMLGDQLAIDRWVDRGATTNSVTRNLNSGEQIPIIFEYYENGGAAVAQLSITDLSSQQTISQTSTVSSPDMNVVSDADSDNDGVPDYWELTYGTDAFANDSDEVLNSAGVTSLQAYTSGLSPYTLESVSGSEPGTADGTVTDSTSASTVTVSWTAPSTRVDGTSFSLGEIDYYVLSYGSSTDAMTNKVEVPGEEVSYTFEGLKSGTWYFTIQVVDTQGLASEQAEPVSYTVK